MLNRYKHTYTRTLHTNTQAHIHIQQTQTDKYTNTHIHTCNEIYAPRPKIEYGLVRVLKQTLLELYLVQEPEEASGARVEVSALGHLQVVHPPIPIERNEE